MKSAPLPINESERLQALTEYNLLDTLSEAVYDDITKMASEICRTPISLISLVDKNRQWFKSKQRLAPNETPRTDSFCAYAILNPEEIMIVPDARVDDRFIDNPLIVGYPNIVFYAGVPLVTPEGHPLGSLCVIDNRTRTLTDNQLLSLRALARLVSTHFELRKTREALEATRNRLDTVDERIQPLVTSLQDNVNILSATNPRPDQLVPLTSLHQVGNSLKRILK